MYLASACIWRLGQAQDRRDFKRPKCCQLEDLFRKGKVGRSRWNPGTHFWCLRRACPKHCLWALGATWGNLWSPPPLPHPRAGGPPVTPVGELLVPTALGLLPQDLFRQFDVDKSGTMSSYELRSALKAAGKEEPGMSGSG